ncbi:MAG TPA: HTTM domain-containing protein [Microbacteriaceae bacterium]|nr:HTTM domain-containing protein [Microbacteriaceae bacterium]
MNPQATNRQAKKQQPNSSPPQAKFTLASFVSFIWLLIKHVTKVIWDTTLRGIKFIEDWLLDSKKALYGIAVTRILLGITAFGLLLTNYRTRLYSFGSGSVWNGEVLEPKSDFPQIWLFSPFHSAITNDFVYTVLYLLLMGLSVLVVLGWRTKIVLPVFWVMWVSFIEANDMLGDQGDNMFRIAVLIMFFTDTSARWSFDAKRRMVTPAKKPSETREQVSNLLHNLGIVALIAQVSFVYMSGALYKAGGAPWSEGYAVYNPLQTLRFGTWPVLSDFFTDWGPMVTILSWGSIILQMGFAFMLLSRPTRVIALAGILSFHIGIGVLMGLPWFSLSMIAVDSIFIRDRTWKSMQDRISSLASQSKNSATLKS